MELNSIEPGLLITDGGHNVARSSPDHLEVNTSCLLSKT